MGINCTDLFFGSVSLTFLQIFSPEVMLICDQVLINVRAYGPKNNFSA